MIHVHSAPAEHLAWLVERTRCNVTPDFHALEAVDERNGRILAMVGYCNWTINAVEAHFAIDSPIAVRAMVRPAFHYPFIHANRRILIGVVPAIRPRSLQMVKHLGFREVHRIPDGWADGEDMVIHEMRRETCRWLLERERKAA